jgi:hypothetical protein
LFPSHDPEDVCCHGTQRRSTTISDSHATITRQSVLCESCGQCKVLDAEMLDVHDVHSESQAMRQLGQASRAALFVASTSRGSHMQTKVPDFAPMRSTMPTCVAATPVFHTDAENAIIFLYATSAAIETILPRLAARTSAFTGLKNRDMFVTRCQLAQQRAAVSAQGFAVHAVKYYSVTQLAPSNAALSPTLLHALQVEVASQTAVGQAFNGVQAAHAASAELPGTFQHCCVAPVLVRMSDVEPRPAVRTCVKMPAPPKVCGRADPATHYATMWAWDVQRCAQCSDIPVQEGLDILARGDARAQVDTMLRDARKACAPMRRCVHRCVVQHRTPVPPQTRAYQG